MSRIDDLIAEHCPDGVEYKTLADSIELTIGTQLNRSTFAEGGKYPVINGGTTPSGYHDEYNTESETITICQGGSAGFVAWMNEPFWAGGHCYIVKPKPDLLLNRFLYFYLKKSQSTLQSLKVGAGVPGLSRKQLLSLPIPLPPLPVQEAIVEILDSFTLLEAELEAELEARKKQYEYYRNHLLTFDDAGGAGWLRLSDICEYRKDRGILSDTEYIYIGVEDLLPGRQGISPNAKSIKSANQRAFLPGDILLGNIRPYLKKIWFASSEGRTNGDVLVFNVKDKDKLLSKYLYFILSSDNFFRHCVATSKGAKMPRGDKDSIMNYMIQIPSIQIQEKIIETLQDFEKLTNDISTGLPAEIRARRRQYEYYRDILLSFKELKEVA